MMRGFWAVVAVYVVVLCGITLPTPLYVIYQQRLGLGEGMVTLLFATYPLAVLVVLPVPGLRSTQTLTAFRAYSKKDLEQAWDIGLE